MKCLLFVLLKVDERESCNKRINTGRIAQTRHHRKYFYTFTSCDLYFPTYVLSLPRRQQQYERIGLVDSSFYLRLPR